MMWMIWACAGDEPCTDDCETNSQTETGPRGNDLALDLFPPVVVETTPESGDLAVSTKLSVISVTFSKRMMDDSWSWVTTGEAEFPDLGDVGFIDEQTHEGTGIGVQPATTYQVWFNALSYTSFVDTNQQAALAYPLAFHTGDGSAAGALDGLPPSVISSVPQAGTDEVDPALDRLQVVFSVDMDPATSGWDEQTENSWPTTLQEGFDGRRTAWLDVELHPGTTYAIGIDGFRAADGTLAAPWLLTFRTAE